MDWNFCSLFLNNSEEAEAFIEFNSKNNESIGKYGKWQRIKDQRSREFLRLQLC